MRRFTPVLVALLLGTGIAPAHAAIGSNGGSLAVTNAGVTAANLIDGDLVTATVTGLSGHSNSVTQTLTAQWDPARQTVDPSGIVAPEGWAKQYTTDGNTWSGSQPTPASDIRGVRASGTYTANGSNSGRQQLSATSTGSVTTPAASFNGSSGGDGYDVTIAGEYVLNVFHHSATTNGKYNLDCHLIRTGAACGPLYQVSGYTTPQGSSAAYVEAQHKVYSFVAYGSESGVLCTDISALPFTNCGYTSIANYNGGGLGYQSYVGGRLYAAVNVSATEIKLLCADLTASPVAPCANQPYAAPDSKPLALAFQPSWTTVTPAAGAVPARVFVTATSVAYTHTDGTYTGPDTAVNCYLAADGTACAGTWPVHIAATTYRFSPWVHRVVPRMNASGVATGICALSLTADTTSNTTRLPCFDFTGALQAPPSGYYTKATAPYFDANIAASYALWGGSGTKQFWWNGSVAVCYDWATDASCAGFTNANINTARYTIVADPTNPNCMWSNGDNGVITQFSTIDGATTCPPVEAEITYPYTALVPRMACNEPGRVRSWEDLTFAVPGGVTVTSLKVTVRDSAGNDIPGYTNVHPNGSGVVDLSGLSVATSTTQPSVYLLGPGVSIANAGAISATMRFNGDGTQLCVPLTSIVDCPTLTEGQQPAASVDPGDITTSAIVHTIGASTTTDTLSEVATSAPISGCVGDLDVDVSYTNGNPVTGTMVELVSGSTVLATGTTDAQGRVRFAHLSPSANYEVRAASQQSASPVVAAQTTSRSFVIPLPAPTTPAPTTAPAAAQPQTLSVTSRELVADEVRSSGTTVLVTKALTTNTGGKVQVSVTCAPRHASLRPTGDVRLCVVKRSDQGRVAVWLPGTRATRVTLRLHATSQGEYSAMNVVRNYFTKRVN